MPKSISFEAFLNNSNRKTERNYRNENNNNWKINDANEVTQ